jgi:hypothetical protein
MRKLILLVLYVILISQVELARKKKKKQKYQNETIAENPLNLKPDRITSEHYCDVCIAIIKEMTKKLRNGKKESDVLDAVSDVCNPEYYNSYRKLN